MNSLIFLSALIRELKNNNPAKVSVALAGLLISANDRERLTLASRLLSILSKDYSESNTHGVD